MTLLGIGKGRLARTESGAPDMRCGPQARGSTVQSDSVRAFFHNAYSKLGESLPDKFVRRRKKKGKRVAESDSSDLEVASGDEDGGDEALLEWLDRGSNTAVHNACVNAGTLVKRWMPPGNLAELYDHYQVVQSLLGCPAASLLGMI